MLGSKRHHHAPLAHVIADHVAGEDEGPAPKRVGAPCWIKLGPREHDLDDDVRSEIVHVALVHAPPPQKGA